MPEYCVVFITVGQADEACRLARGLVEAGLAACVNRVPRVESIYRWQGEICSDEEHLLIAKTQTAHWEALCAWVRANHSYTTPEIIRLPIEAGDTDYLSWLSGCLG